MTPELHATLTGWLATGTEAQKAHAAYRLSLPDALGYEPPPAAPEYPPLREQAANLAGSVLEWARAGFPLAPFGERARRRAICLGCPLFDAKQRRCTKCGCAAAVKPWLKTARCPEGKW